MSHRGARTGAEHGPRARRGFGRTIGVVVLFLAATWLGPAVVVRAGERGTSAAAQQPAPGPPVNDGSVVAVVTRDTSGNQIGRGIGFFVEIGRLVLPRTLLLDRAYSAAVIYGRSEQRVTAVLADEPRTGLALVAVDLPDGAPPAIAARPRTTTVAAARYFAVAPEGTVALAVSAPVDVPGLGTVCPLTAGGTLPTTGTPLVDDEGFLFGVVTERTAGTERLSFVLPAARALSLAPVGPLSIGEWRQRPQAARTEQGEAAYLRGIRAWLDGRRDEAAGSFRQAANGSADVETHVALGAAELAAGHLDAGVASYRAAIAADPSNARLRHELGLALADADRWDEAAAEFAEVTRLRPTDADAHFNLGSAYGRLGRLDAEYAAYQAALQGNPAHLKALRNLGIVCIALKRYAEAVAVSSRAVRFVPTDASLHTQLGVAYFDLGDHASAIEELKKAVALEPGLVKAHYGLALVYAASGQHAEARSECETLKRLDPARGAEVSRLVGHAR